MAVWFENAGMPDFGSGIVLKAAKWGPPHRKSSAPSGQNSIERYQLIAVS
jgi:hypothetical protein